MSFPSAQFSAALATTFHPQMEAQALEYLERHFMAALEEIGWTVQPKATDGQTSDEEVKRN